MKIFQTKFGYLLESVLASMVIGIIIPFVFYLRASFSNEQIENESYLFGFIFSFTVSFCIYFVNVPVVRKLHKFEKLSDFQVLRIALELIITMSFAGIVMVLVHSAYAHFYVAESKEDISLFDNIIIALVVDVVVVTILEIIYFFKKWKNSLIESEQLRRKNVEIQYAALTNQINPHFLFNSLNILTSLIQEDPDKALLFTKEFSKIYRYVLDSKDKLIVSLQSELDFMNSYLYLQKIRFDSSLNYQTEIDVNCLDYFLPPLSLQLLVENAIKHNEISEQNPLNLNIKGSNQELIVSNNFQPKEKTTNNTGIGLKNLTERYSHYTDQKPVFKIENNSYVAKIPLIIDE